MKYYRLLVLFCFVILIFCANLSLSFADNEHEWGPWIIDKEPTCQSEGHKHRVCYTFPESPHRGEEVDIPKLNHHVYTKTVKKATCTEPELFLYVCKYCGYSYSEEISPPLGHDYGPWFTVKKATTKEEGLKEKICQRDSSHVIKKSIPILKAKPSLASTKSKDKGNNLNLLDILIYSSCILAASIYTVLILRNYRIINWTCRCKQEFLLKQGWFEEDFFK